MCQKICFQYREREREARAPLSLSILETFFDTSLKEIYDNEKVKEKEKKRTRVHALSLSTVLQNRGIYSLNNTGHHLQQYYCDNLKTYSDRYSRFSTGLP